MMYMHYKQAFSAGMRSVYSPPLDKCLDKGGVALGGCQMKKSHAPERLGVDQVLGLGPAGAVHHLFANYHHTAFKGVASRTLTLALTLTW